MAIIISNSNTLKVNLEAIRAALNETYAVLSNGQTGNDLGFLCRSSKVNPKSKNKPVCSSSTSSIADSQRKALNYGNTMQFYSTLAEAMKEVAAGTNVGYNQPAGGTSERYRLYDFNGYEHAEGNWLNFSTMQSSTQEDATCNFEVEGFGPFNGYGSSSIIEFFSFGFMSAYSTSNGGINLGFAVKSSTFTTALASMYYYPITGELTISDIIGNDRVQMQLNSQLDAGTWYLYPVLCTASYTTYPSNTLHYISLSDSSALWLPLPYCNVIQLEVAAGTGAIGNISAYFVSGVAVQGTMSYYWVISQVYVQFRNSSSAAITLEVDAEMTDYYSGQTIIGRNVAVPAGELIQVDVLNGQTVTYESATDYPSIKITYKATGGGGESVLNASLIER